MLQLAVHNLDRLKLDLPTHLFSGHFAVALQFLEQFPFKKKEKHKMSVSDPRCCQIQHDILI